MTFMVPKNLLFRSLFTSATKPKSILDEITSCCISFTSLEQNRTKEKRREEKRREEKRREEKRREEKRKVTLMEVFHLPTVQLLGYY